MKHGLILLVRIYQWTLRPFIGAHCRFEPSCSAYAIEAMQTYGAVRGGRAVGPARAALQSLERGWDGSGAGLLLSFA